MAWSSPTFGVRRDKGVSGFRVPRFQVPRRGREIVEVRRFQGSSSTSQVVTRRVLTSVHVPARFQVPGSWGGAEPRIGYRGGDAPSRRSKMRLQGGPLHAGWRCREHLVYVGVQPSGGAVDVPTITRNRSLTPSGSSYSFTPHSYLFDDPVTAVTCLMNRLPRLPVAALGIPWCALQRVTRSSAPVDRPQTCCTIALKHQLHDALGADTAARHQPTRRDTTPQVHWAAAPDPEPTSPTPSHSRLPACPCW
eukprot:scaffold601_cov73-Phaeocystis_antarctica.AAC.4